MDRRGWLAVGVIAIAALVWLVFFGSDDEAWTPEDREAAAPQQDDPALRGAGAPEAAGTAPALEGRGDASGTKEPPRTRATRKAEAHEGVITLTYEQGWSFLERKVLAKGEDDPDLVLSDLAGGAASVELKAPGGGMANALALRTHLPDVATAQGLYDGLVRGHADKLRLQERARGSRLPHSDVFIAKTIRGEWVKLAIVHRDESPRGWQEFRITIVYALNPDEPVFAKGKGDVVQAGFEVARGMVTDRQADIVAELEAAAEERDRPFREAMRALDERARPYADAVTRPGHHVAAAMVRRTARDLGARDDYNAATYSFEKQTRDDAKATRNDWDFVLSHGNEGPWLRVRTVTDDRSFIWDLGAIDFEQALRGDVQQVEGQFGVAVRADHLYLIHTLDRESDHWVLMKALSIGEGEELIFEWRLVEDPTPLRRALEPKDKELTEPYARLQVLSDHGGGNPHRAFLDGSKNAYVDHLKAAPLDLTTSAATRNRRDGSQAFVIGGYVPEGKVFRITSVEVTLHADKPSRMDTLVRVGRFTVVGIQNAHWRRDETNDKLELFTADRGIETITARNFPIRRTIAVDIPIARDQEKHVFVEGASFTRNDVILRGRLEPAPKTPSPVDAWADRHRRTAEHLWKNLLRNDDTEQARLQFVRSFHNLDDGEVWLARVRDHLTDDTLRRRADKVLEMLR